AATPGTRESAPSAVSAAASPALAAGQEPARPPRITPSQSAGWSGKPVGAGEPAGPRGGPIGGFARGVPTVDVAFAGGKIKPIADAFGAGAPDSVSDGVEDDDLSDRGHGSKLGRWIVIASLVLMAGAAVVV